MKKRYYFWQYLPFKQEWRQLGCMSGYATLRECKRDNKFYMVDEIKMTGEKYPYAILEARPIVKG